MRTEREIDGRQPCCDAGGSENDDGNRCVVDLKASPCAKAFGAGAAVPWRRGRTKDGSLTCSKSTSPTDVFIDVHASPSRTHAARSRPQILGAPIAALLGNRTESSLRPYQQVVRSRCRMFRQDQGSPVHARATAVVATFRQIVNQPGPSVWMADFRSLVGCTPGGHSSAGRAGLRMRPIALCPGGREDASIPKGPREGMHAAYYNRR